MFSLDTIIFIVVLFILFIIIEKYFKEHEQIKIIFTGLIIVSIFFIISRNASLAWVAKVFNILSVVGLILIVYLILISYMKKLR